MGTRRGFQCNHRVFMKRKLELLLILFLVSLRKERRFLFFFPMEGKRTKMLEKMAGAQAVEQHK
jgi:hypothetical protein